MHWRIRIHTIDVDQGDCSIICLEYMDKENVHFRQQILIDGGRLNQNENIYNYLINNQIYPHFDYIVVTHFHDDHIGGIVKLLEHGNIASFCTSTAKFVNLAIQSYIARRFHFVEGEKERLPFHIFELIPAAALFALGYFTGSDEELAVNLVYDAVVLEKGQGLLKGIPLNKPCSEESLNEVVYGFYYQYMAKRQGDPILQCVRKEPLIAIMNVAQRAVDICCQGFSGYLNFSLEEEVLKEILKSRLFLDIENMCEIKLDELWLPIGRNLRNLTWDCHIITPCADNTFGSLFPLYVSGMVDVGEFKTKCANLGTLKRTWHLDGGREDPICCDAIKYLGKNLFELTISPDLLGDPFLCPRMYLLSVGANTIAGSFTQTDANTCSVGLLFTLGKFSFYTAGDLPSELEDPIMNTLKVTGMDGRTYESITLFKASHHGSESSTSQFFLDLMRPNCVIISCGSSGEFDHPRESMLGRLQNCKTIKRVFLTGCIDQRMFTTPSFRPQGFGSTKAFIAGGYASGSGSIVSTYTLTSAEMDFLSVVCINKDGAGMDRPGLFKCQLAISTTN